MKMETEKILICMINLYFSPLFNTYYHVQVGNKIKC